MDTEIFRDYEGKYRTAIMFIREDYRNCRELIKDQIKRMNGGKLPDMSEGNYTPLAADYTPLAADYTPLAADYIPKEILINPLTGHILTSSEILDYFFEGSLFGIERISDDGVMINKYTNITIDDTPTTLLGDNIEYRRIKLHQTDDIDNVIYVLGVEDAFILVHEDENSSDSD